MTNITLSHFNGEAPAFDWYDSSIITYDDWNYQPNDFNVYFRNGIESIKKYEGRWGRIQYYVCPEDLTDEGWAIFGLEDENERADYFDEKYRRDDSKNNDEYWT
jgi:hypothetical protein